MLSAAGIAERGAIHRGTRQPLRCRAIGSDAGESAGDGIQAFQLEKQEFDIREIRAGRAVAVGGDFPFGHRLIHPLLLVFHTMADTADGDHGQLLLSIFSTAAGGIP